MDFDAPDMRRGRRSFMKSVAAVGASLGLAPLTRAQAAGSSLQTAAAGLTTEDHAILQAALIAEALAVTTYTSIIKTAPLYTRLFPQDQAYLQAARQQEMAHYLLLQKLAGTPLSSTHYYYPAGMFAMAATTIKTLVSLEEAFIAAYLVGVRRFSTADLRVAAARIMGIESDHRTMARVLAPGLDPADGGPLRTVSGIQHVAEAVDPANNNGYERTLGWTRIDQALAALLPFADATAATAAHFDVTKQYTFQPFTPTPTSSLGAF